MLDKVQKTIEKYNMVQKGESLLCCLSGGADSVALLLCLKELGYSIKSCHVNHMLRGEESERDQAFCEKLCERLEIPIKIRRIDAAAFSRDNGYSLEEGARVLRYRIFDECTAQKRMKIATAHTLSDCLETTLFRLARGTGIDGLLGIPPVRDNIIRPLIACRRDEIESFLTGRGMEWVTDSSNLSDDYSRNRIRHKVVPGLKAVNTSLEKTYEGTLDNFREDVSLLKKLSDELYYTAVSGGTADCKMLCEAEPALSGRVLKRLLAENGAYCSRETVLRIITLCRDGGKLTLGNGLYAASRDGKLTFENESAPAEPQEIKAETDTEYEFFDKKVMLALCDISVKSDNIHNNVTNYCADYGKIKGKIFIRSRRAGDKIKFIGKGFTTTIKKLFQSELPRDERIKTVILSDDEGPFFVEGFGFAERVKKDCDTKTVLFCKIS